MKLIQPPQYTQTGPDDGVSTLTISLTANDRCRFWPAKTTRKTYWGRRVVRDTRALRELLFDSDLVIPSGCDCSHCRNDWDCCGRMVPKYVSIKRINATDFKVTQHFSRNV